MTEAVMAVVQELSVKRQYKPIMIHLMKSQDSKALRHDVKTYQDEQSERDRVAGLTSTSSPSPISLW